jgi:hypothetical protein
VNPTQYGLFDDQSAHARRTDPWTSHAAADSLTSDKIRRSQDAVLRFLRERGGMDDGTLVAAYDLQPPQSPSGLRTRRAELVSRGLVRDSGRTITTTSGRKSIVWEAV